MDVSRQWVNVEDMPKLRAPKRQPVVVSAIHANRGTQVWYFNQLQNVLAAMKQEMLNLVRAAYGITGPDIGFAQDAPSRVTALQRALKKWGDNWTDNLDKMSLDIAAHFASKSFRNTEFSMEQAFKQAGFTVKFSPSRKSAEAYRAVVAENVGLIKSIPQQYLKDVQTQVWQSVMKGADMAQLSEGLRKSYGVSVDRAALIARDQNNKAKAVLENTRRQQLGLKRAIWMHSHGGKKPRRTHLAANGKPYDLDKGMYDEDEGEWVWPGQLINCRCTSRAIVPGFEDDDD